MVGGNSIVLDPVGPSQVSTRAIILAQAGRTSFEDAIAGNFVVCCSKGLRCIVVWASRWIGADGVTPPSHEVENPSVLLAPVDFAARSFGLLS